jgi:hypothetical protein
MHSWAVHFFKSQQFQWYQWMPVSPNGDDRESPANYKYNISLINNNSKLLIHFG